ncbi:MAG: Gfo/Idh/MocA family protein [Planctomycetota bacterium]|jgi:predicted dehydrogenase
MKIAIIGASRNRNGIGQYIAKYFQKNHAAVTAVLGSTEKTAQSAVAGLGLYGIKAKAYGDFDRMIRLENPNAIVIASPVQTHYEYLVKSIDSGLNIFCEKPFFWHPKESLPEMLDNLFKRAAHKKLTIAMNAQWPFSIPYYQELCGPIDTQPIDTFFIHLSPIFTGKEMLIDSLPHGLSMLHFALGAGEIHSLETEKDVKKIALRFNYRSNNHNCKVLIRLESQKQQPRSFQYGFNGKIVSRVVDSDNYDIHFKYQNRNIKIADPLELSVKDFIAALREQREPVIGKSHIVATTLLLKKIYDQYETK